MGWMEYKLVLMWLNEMKVKIETTLTMVAGVVEHMMVLDVDVVAVDVKEEATTVVVDRTATCMKRGDDGATEEPPVDRTTALLAALTARKTTQEKAQEPGMGSTPEQGSVNLLPDPRDDAMITLLEQQKLLREEIQEMRRKMGARKVRRTIQRSRRRTKHPTSLGLGRASPTSGVEETRNRAEAHQNPAMLYAGALDEVMCRAFPSTLDGDAQLWFSDLPSGSISSFKQLSKRFTSYFATSRTIKRTAHCLKNVVQGKDESLKDFLIRFTKEGRPIQGLKMEVALSYLTNNLRSKLFCCSITKKPPKTMVKLLARSTKYIAFEEGDKAEQETGEITGRMIATIGAMIKGAGKTTRIQWLEQYTSYWRDSAGHRGRPHTKKRAGGPSGEGGRAAPQPQRGDGSSGLDGERHD
ncbi:uncharacterized protein G2W53_007307 [Senna tora]|uniref:Retrotransposon gag domain-containing protein n=1 Tax=Senna tora TaxID=362788 RepID=A0A834X6G9_9FABA|nr:uncharacterized protein G2W53_007307 [Senna tora]